LFYSVLTPASTTAAAVEAASATVEAAATEAGLSTRGKAAGFCSTVHAAKCSRTIARETSSSSVSACEAAVIAGETSRAATIVGGKSAVISVEVRIAVIEGVAVKSVRAASVADVATPPVESPVVPAPSVSEEWAYAKADPERNVWPSNPPPGIKGQMATG
jgi:hypothetical protein